VNEQYLMDSAKRLCQPPERAAAEFESVAGELASELNRRMAARPDLERLIGADNRPMMEDNSRNFCRFMSAMFHAYEPEVLVRTALWVFRAYRAHGFHTTYWPANLDTFVEIARQRLTPETFSVVEPFFLWLIVHIPVFVKISDEQLAEPLGVLPVHGAAGEP
jgi:hypothetical protein